MLRYLTTGESHGGCLIAVLEGMPSGLKLDQKAIDAEMYRRQLGYGRGPRMLSVEKDRAEFLSGVRQGKTIGSPLTMRVPNKDDSIDRMPKVTRPRPGHADLTGALKYGTKDIRDILERASARETAARVAVGAVCKEFLKSFDVEIFSHVVGMGGVLADVSKLSFTKIKQQSKNSPLHCADKKAEADMIALVDKAKSQGDTVGGIVEILILGAPLGLGSHVQYDRKLDARLAGALMSIQAIKAVEVGDGTRVSEVMGSELHDQIYYSKSKGYYRKTSRSGGFEGGMTTGEPIALRIHMKPLSTLLRPLDSVDIETKKPFKATVERTDVSAVPSAGVVAESVAAFEVTKAFLEKFGGDSMKEVTRNYKGFMRQIKNA